MDKKIMVPKEGKGDELRELLMRELNIPKTARWFEVRFAIDEVVTVTCSYMAEERQPQQPPDSDD